MTARPEYLYVRESKAAVIFDMKTVEFRALVDSGRLPPPRDFDGLKRWDVEELRRIAKGEAVEGMGNVPW